jgi:hypothetical protein
MRAEFEGRPVIQHVDDGLVSYREVAPGGLAPHPITNAADTAGGHFIIELIGPSHADAPGPHQHNGRARPEPLGRTRVR